MKGEGKEETFLLESQVRRPEHAFIVITNIYGARTTSPGTAIYTDELTSHHSLLSLVQLYPHHAEKGIWAHRSKATCPKSHGYWAVQAGFGLGRIQSSQRWTGL